MPKNLFQDMVKVKNSRKQMEQIKIIRSSSPTPIPPDIEKQKYIHENIERPRYSPPQKNSKHRLWLVAGICILFFLFALSFFFARAEVVIDPKIKDVQLNQSFSAIKDVNNEGLAFDLVIISGEDSNKVVGGEQKDLALSATGSIFIYNAFSTTPQKLSVGTKLEGSNNKIYKIITPATVPGIDADGVPGKVEVSILAMEAGDEYNSDPIDFKISIFKGTPKYDKFYGRSEGKISGGFKGMSATIADTEKEVAFSELEASLKDKLLAKATDQIPSGFILYKGAAFLKIDERSVEFAPGDSNVPVKVKGTLYGFLLSEETLTPKIAKAGVSEYDDAPVYIPNIRDLTFSLLDTDISYSDVQSINFNISGNPKIVWTFDETEFKQSLLSKKKSEFNQILSQYTNVQSAQLSLSPFWIRSFPSKLKDIKVIVNYP